MNVTVIGTGYVGTVTGACLAYLGHRVWCVDTDAAKIEKLQAGQSPIFEPGLEDLMRLCTERGLLEFTTDLTEPVRQSDVIFVAVGTPPLPSGESNLTYVEAAARSIGAVMDTSIFRVVVNKSTVPVGSGNLVGTLVREGISAAGRQNVRFGMASNPEFLREGSAIHDSLYPDRIVIGTEEPETLAVMRNLYAELGSQQFPDPSFEPRPLGTTSVPVVETTLTSAEMIKYSANAFLATKIGFANEIANICERVGADVTEVMQGIGLDSRIGTKFLNAGIGWGGSCFGKDIGSLLHTAGEYGYQASLLEASLLVNKRQRLLVIQKLQEKLFILKGRTIGLLGLSFKPNTDDLRDAPSLQIAERLIQMGARVRAYDPISMDACREQNPDLRILYCNDALSMAEHADALVLITEWPEFGMLDLRELASRMDHAVLIDGRNMFDAACAAAAGFDYTGMGRATHRTATPASK
ncbi:MAG: UDP-glucose/GDP-mannose dehydrogenase family protein [Acidobacteriia bacterium]|nr:UDP-glucose/GDP-mannose dehydrogenase family protein [Terriglobia bacterium]